MSVIENGPPPVLSNEDLRSASSMNIASNMIISLHSVLILAMKTSTNPDIIAEFERSVYVCVCVVGPDDYFLAPL